MSWTWHFLIRDYVISWGTIFDEYRWRLISSRWVILIVSSWAWVSVSVRAFRSSSDSVLKSFYKKWYYLRAFILCWWIILTWCRGESSLSLDNVSSVWCAYLVWLYPVFSRVILWLIIVSWAWNIISSLFLRSSSYQEWICILSKVVMVIILSRAWLALSLLSDKVSSVTTRHFVNNCIIFDQFIFRIVGSWPRILIAFHVLRFPLNSVSVSTLSDSSMLVISSWSR